MNETVIRRRIKEVPGPKHSKISLPLATSPQQFDSKPPREVDCDKPHRKIIKILGRRSPKTSTMSKITAAGVRTHVDELLNYSNGERKRNFVETVELQVSLKDYNPQRDKRFSSTIRLPSAPRQGGICLLGDQHGKKSMRTWGFSHSCLRSIQILTKPTQISIVLSIVGLNICLSMI